MNNKSFTDVWNKLLARTSLVTLTISLAFLGACSNPQAKTFSGAPIQKANRIHSTKDIAEAFNKILSEPDIEDKIRYMDTAEFFAIRQSLATDDIIEIGGYQFEGLAESMKAEAEHAAEYALDFPTIGDIMEAKGIDSLPTSITEQVIELMAKNLTRLMNSEDEFTDPSSQEGSGFLRAKDCREARRAEKYCGEVMADSCSAHVSSYGQDDGAGFACVTSAICDVSAAGAEHNACE